MLFFYDMVYLLPVIEYLLYEKGNQMRKNKTSKYIREYGLTIQEMSEKYNLSMHYLYLLHIKGELHAFIAEQESKEKVAEK